MDASTENEASDTGRLKNSERLGEEKSELQEGALIEGKMSPENSDYDSADSYTDEEQNVKIRSKASDIDDQSHSDTGSVILERQEGDGQESIPTKKVDDDEDKKNPQYIPKKGTFYEHDDRTLDEENENEVEKDKDNKKKVWQDKKEKWIHDKFNDLEQAPKSRSELVAIYGYDIRNEEGPPRARRRRRYGRGPNKYTRTWEDEAAYVKAPTTVKTKKQRKPENNSAEDFPPLVKNDENRHSPDSSLYDKQPSNGNQSSNENRSSTEYYSENENNKRKDQNYNSRKSQERAESIKETSRDNGSTSTTQHYVDNKNHQNTSTSKDNRDLQNNKNASQRTNSGRVVKPRKEFKDSDRLGFTTKTRQFRQAKNDNQKVLPARNQPKDEIPNKAQSVESETSNNTVQDVEKDFNKLNITGGVHKGSKGNNQQQRQGSVPPRLQNEQKGPKRYSSMRQRSLPEANTPPAVQTYQHAGYYPTEYNQQSDPTAAAPQPIIHQAAPIHHGTPQVAQIPPQTIPLPQQGPPVTAAPILQAQFPQGFPQAPPAAFLQPAVPPPAYIPPQPAQIINYVQGQPTFTPNYQGFQQQFNPVHELLFSSDTHFSPPITTEQLQTPPAELYQPQGGITYYSTDQQVSQRSVPQKRPKVAIPIVAPPSEDKKTAMIEQQTIEQRDEASESTEVQE